MMTMEDGGGALVDQAPEEGWRRFSILLGFEICFNKN